MTNQDSNQQGNEEYTRPRAMVFVYEFRKNTKPKIKLDNRFQRAYENKESEIFFWSKGRVLDAIVSRYNDGHIEVRPIMVDKVPKMLESFLDGKGMYQTSVELGKIRKKETEDSG